MVEDGAIRRSISPWASAVVLLRKKDGGLRFCIDFHKLNYRTVKDGYSLPRIEDTLDCLHGIVWLVESCLCELHLNWCLIYLDGIIVFSQTPEEHLYRLKAVFNKLKAAGLKLKLSKCDLFKQQINYLGNVVSKEGVSTDPEKIQVVTELLQPTTVSEVRSFL